MLFFIVKFELSDIFAAIELLMCAEGGNRISLEEMQAGAGVCIDSEFCGET